MMLKLIPLFAFLLLLQIKLSAQAEPTPLDVDLEVFITGANNPVDLVFYDDIMYIVDQDGIINMAEGDQIMDDVFMDISSIVQYSGERGLLGMAFDPAYDSNNTFYLNYVNNSGNTVIAAYQSFTDSLAGNPLSATILLTIDQPYSNHNGGQIRFGDDGYLYIGMGDGGSAGDPQSRSQNPQELLGKMLRIDVNADSYSIPDDNPFVNDALVLDEIWALGVRNPWRFSFDMETGDLWIGDVGQSEYEEIDFQDVSSAGGENWGWRCYEGFHSYNTSGCGPSSDYDDPIFEYEHIGGSCSVTGGYVYRGIDSDLLNGVYLGIDYCSGYLFGIRRLEDEDIESFDFGNFGFGYTCFGQDADGEMYVAKSNGTIYKIVDPCHSQTPLLSYEDGVLNVDSAANYFWFVNGNEIEGNNQSSYAPTENGIYYCITENEYGCNIVSNEVDVTLVGIDEYSNSNFVIYPNPFSSDFSIKGFEAEIQLMTIYSLSGRELWTSKQIDGSIIKAPEQLAAGTYVFQIEDKEGNKHTQLIFKK